MKVLFLSILLSLQVITFCQDIGVTFSPNPFTARKYENEKLVIPIDIVFEKTVGSSALTSPLVLPIQVTLHRTAGIPAPLQFTTIEFGQIALQNLTPDIRFDTATRKCTVNLHAVLPAALSIPVNKALLLTVSISGNPVSTKQLSIEPASEVVYDLNTYDNTATVKLDYVTKVESNNNVLTVSGYKNDGFTKRSVLLKNNDVLAVIENKYISWGKGYWNSIPFSLITVPFKIRPRNKVSLTKTNPSTDTTYAATAMSGITNLGVHLDLVKRTTERYFSSGKKSGHKWAFGVFVAPGVEELGAAQIKDFSLGTDGKSKQFFVSGGCAVSYAYNGITFLLVPAAADWAPSSIGKQWIYHKKFWWGFGIGVSPTLLGQAFNK